MEYLIQLITAIAWPITVLAIVFLLRSELRTAAGRLSALRYKDFRADFEHELAELQSEVKALPENAKDESDKTTTLDASDQANLERLLRIADISPRAAIMEAWRDIEVTTKQVTDAYGISVGGQIAGVKAIREMVSNGLLPGSVVSIYERLRRLRSRAAHAHNFSVDPDEAESYIELADQFYTTLRFLLRQREEASGETQAT